MADKERAKEVICAIVRHAGGALTNKTNLFKAFYHSHLIYAEQHPGYLSDWPIVRMPKGPGIDNFDTLAGELMIEGKLHLKTVSVGDFVAFQFQLTDSCGESLLEAEELNAIAEGTDRVLGKTATQVSDESHLRSWHSTPNGQEMNIYIDSIPEEEYQENKKRMAPMIERLDEILGTND